MAFGEGADFGAVAPFGGDRGFGGIVHGRGGGGGDQRDFGRRGGGGNRQFGDRDAPRRNQEYGSDDVRENRSPRDRYNEENRSPRGRYNEEQDGRRGFPPSNRGRGFDGEGRSKDFGGDRRFGQRQMNDNEEDSGKLRVKLLLYYDGLILLQAVSVEDLVMGRHGGFAGGLYADDPPHRRDRRAGFGDSDPQFVDDNGYGRDQGNRDRKFNDRGPRDGRGRNDDREEFGGGRGQFGGNEGGGREFHRDRPSEARGPERGFLRGGGFSGSREDFRSQDYSDRGRGPGRDGGGARNYQRDRDDDRQGGPRDFYNRENDQEVIGILVEVVEIVDFLRMMVIGSTAKEGRDFPHEEIKALEDEMVVTSTEGEGMMKKTGETVTIVIDVKTDVEEDHHLVNKVALDLVAVPPENGKVFVSGGRGTASTDERAPRDWVPENTEINKLFERDTINAEHFENKLDDKVEVIGAEGFNEISSWENSGLHPDLIKICVEKCHYKYVRPIQAAAIPLIMRGYDVMGLAETGGGKTAAFVLPILHYILGLPESERSKRGAPIALVVAPTRELAKQLYDSFRKHSYETGISCCVSYGQIPKFTSLKEIHKGCDVLVGTSGRLMDLVERSDISLSKLKFLVLDEADMLLEDRGDNHLKVILDSSKIPDIKQRQTLLFSATFPPDVKRFAGDVLKERYVMIRSSGRANVRVTQTFIQADGVSGKNEKLFEILQDLRDKRTDDGKNLRTLVFVDTRDRANFLALMLGPMGIKAESITGNRPQNERERVVQELRDGTVHVLVGTDVCQRGLDITGLDVVINYDIPSGSPAEVAKETDQDVPQWLENMSSTGSTSFSNRSGGFGASGGGFGASGGGFGASGFGTSGFGDSGGGSDFGTSGFGGGGGGKSDSDGFGSDGFKAKPQQASDDDDDFGSGTFGAPASGGGNPKEKDDQAKNSDEDGTW
ncbi:unnamed protein product [Nippostrongylus brasiliensis]|uniref:RNA helicase n=1 Tax=Nippostrongylus brasiliensis TaxID=27835 RepID=A0A158R0R6_NIPBR|nr:unnamed protein product [Nippostrongylus brasiliensis]